MNKADNDAGNAAIDSLLNYETVKVKKPKAFLTVHIVITWVDLINSACRFVPFAQKKRFFFIPFC